MFGPPDTIDVYSRTILFNVLIVPDKQRLIKRWKEEKKRIFVWRYDYSKESTGSYATNSFDDLKELYTDEDPDSGLALYEAGMSSLKPDDGKCVYLVLLMIAPRGSFHASIYRFTPKQFVALDYDDQRPVSLPVNRWFRSDVIYEYLKGGVKSVFGNHPECIKNMEPGEVLNMDYNAILEKFRWVVTPSYETYVKAFEKNCVMRLTSVETEKYVKSRCTSILKRNRKVIVLSVVNYTRYYYLVASFSIEGDVVKVKAKGPKDDPITDEDEFEYTIPYEEVVYE